MLDRQILFEPLEEQFDLPTLLVDGCDSERGKVETVLIRLSQTTTTGSMP